MLLTSIRQWDEVDEVDMPARTRKMALGDFPVRRSGVNMRENISGR
jgi:hypothetical protein